MTRTLLLAVLPLAALPLFAAGSFADERKDRQEEQPASSFYELRDRGVVRIGDKIFLTDAEGDVIAGKIESLAWEDAILTLGTRTISEADIRRIEVEMHDPLANGAMIGAASGAGMILIGYAIDRLQGRSEAVTDTLAFAGIFGGLGAALGLGIDDVVKDRRLIFDAAKHKSAWNLRIVPLLSKHQKGIAVSLSF